MLFPLIPIPRGRKGPVLKNWQALAPEQLAQAFQGQNKCNRGVRLDHYAVLDPDTNAAGQLLDGWEQEGMLPPTIAWRTAAGNIKRLFKRPSGLQSCLTIQAVKLQLRTGAGMQDVIPPSYVKDPEKGIDGHYAWLPGQDPESIEPAELPGEILAYFREHSNNGNGQNANPIQTGTNYGAYAQRALADELARLASTPGNSHNRNNQLNRSAFALGQLIGAGVLDRGSVEAALYGVAASIGLGEVETRATIKSGLEAGIKEPRKLPERDRPRNAQKDEGSRPNQETHKCNAHQTLGEPPAPLQWPQEVMTGAAGLFAKSYGNYLETPQSFLFMAYMTYLGHVVSDRITLQSEITPQPRLFTILLGESADDRKTTSISKTHRFYQDVVSPDDLNTVWGVGSAEGLAKCFKKNNRALLVLDELKSLIQKMRIDASVLLPCINTLFESKYFHSLTKKHDITLDYAELCLLAASTLETYRNMFNATFLDIGFLNRLFIVIGNSERKFSIPDLMPQDIRESLKSDLKEVLSFAGEISKAGQYAMPVEPQAKEIFDAWYFGLERSSFAKRLDTYGHRLMPLLAVNEMRPTITPGIAQKAVALLNYQLAARKFADPIDADSAIARLEERIRRLLAGGPTLKRDLERRGSKNRVGIWAWDQAIKNLRNAGEIFWDSKTREFRLNG